MKILSASSIFNYAISYILDKDDYLKKMSDYALSDKGAKSYKTNVYAKMSDWDIFNKTNLFDPLLDTIKEMIKHLGSINPTDEVFFTDMWTAVYRDGDFTRPHDHATFLSFVVCLEDGGVSHPLIFTDSGLEVEMHKGKVVLFPGYVVHHVPVYRNNKPRIIVAGNIDKIISSNEDNITTGSIVYE